MVETKGGDSRTQFTRSGDPDGKAEHLGKCIADGSIGNGHADGIPVAEPACDFKKPGLLFIDGSLRTMRKALAAMDACLLERHAVRPARSALYDIGWAVLLAGIAPYAARLVDLKKGQSVGILPGSGNMKFRPYAFRFHTLHSTSLS